MKQDNILRYLEQAGAPFILLLLIFSALCVFSLVSSSRLRWLTFVPLFYFASLWRPEVLPWWDITLSQPLQMLSRHSRIVTMAFLHILAFGLLFAPRGSRVKVVTPAVVALFTLEMAFSIKMVASGVGLRGILSAYTYFLIFLTFTFGLGRMLQTIEDCYRCLQVYVAVVGLIVLGTLFEVVFHPTGVIAGQRLFATTANPQAAGTIFAFALPAIAVIISRKQSRILAKPILIALAGIVGVFLLWTGSRTGALAAIAGCAVLFRHKLTHSTLVLGIIAICSYALMQMAVFEGSHGAAQRLLSTSNTRAEPWSALINDFISNPAFGKKLTGGSTKESSILGTASNLGIVGLAILSVFLLHVGKLSFQLIRISRRMPDHANLASAIAGGFAAMVISWILDGYLYGVTTLHVFFLYFYLAIGACLVELDGHAPQPVPLVWYDLRRQPT